MRPDILFARGRALARWIESKLAGVDNPIARLLIRPAGPRGTGPDGTWTRADHRRAFFLGWVGLLLGWTVAMVLFAITDLYPIGRGWTRVLSLAGLILLFLATYGWWMGLKHTGAAFRRRTGLDS